MSQSQQTSTAAVLGGDEITTGPNRRVLCGLRQLALLSGGHLEGDGNNHASPLLPVDIVAM